MISNRAYKLVASLIFILLLLCLVVSFFESTRKEGKDVIVVTTDILGDIVKNIVKDREEVVVLMGAGVDPHSYEPTLDDIQNVESARIVVFHGLHFEGTLSTDLEKLSRIKNFVYKASDALNEKDVVLDKDFSGGQDPHFFHDVRLFIKTANFLEKKLARANPSNANFYRQNALVYIKKLEELDALIRRRIREIPKEKRVLISMHDAFSYFSRAYGIEIRSLQGISTVGTPSFQDRKDLVDFIIKRKIKAIFTEFSVSSKSMLAIQEDCLLQGVEVTCYQVYTDTLGEKETKEDSYCGMMLYNIHKITDND